MQTKAPWAPPDLVGTEHYDVWTYRNGSWGKRQSCTGSRTTGIGPSVHVTALHSDACLNYKPDYVPEGHT